MSEQSFKNHTKWDPAFHFFLMPVLAANFVFSVKHFLAYPNYMTGGLSIVAFALLLLTFKMRLYSLKVQDRLIRLEERLRIEKLTPPELHLRFGELTPKQLVALRFASDAELTDLVRRALDEKLTPKQIKAAIQKWRPDDFRV